MLPHGRGLGVPYSASFPWRGDPHGDRAADNRKRTYGKCGLIVSCAIEEVSGEGRPDESADSPPAIEETKDGTKMLAVVEVSRDYRQLRNAHPKTDSENYRKCNQLPEVIGAGQGTEEPNADHGQKTPETKDPEL